MRSAKIVTLVIVGIAVSSPSLLGQRAPDRASLTVVAWARDASASEAGHGIAFLGQVTDQPVRRTFWLEGGVIAGLLLGSKALEGSGSTSERAVYFLFAASIGFPIGALIGGQIPKPAGDPGDPRP